MHVLDGNVERSAMRIYCGVAAIKLLPLLLPSFVTRVSRVDFSPADSDKPRDGGEVPNTYPG